MTNRNRFSEDQQREIEELLLKTEKVTLYRKLEVIFYASLGWTNATIAKITHYSMSRVSDLVSEYAENGIGYFKEEHRKGGNHRNLQPEEEQALAEEFAAQAQNGQIVKIDDIKRKYDEKCGKTTGLSTLYSFLRRVGWRRVLPRGKHPKKADDEAIEASKKLTLSSAN
jgi:transposase